MQWAPQAKSAFKVVPFCIRPQDLDFLEAEELSFFSKEKNLEEVIHLLKQTSITDVCSVYQIGKYELYSFLLHKIHVQFLYPCYNWLFFSISMTFQPLHLFWNILVFSLIIDTACKNPLYHLCYFPADARLFPAEHLQIFCAFIWVN